MKSIFTFLFLMQAFFMQAQRDTLFYTYNNIPVDSYENCRTYGVLEYKSPDSLQVIETKFRKDHSVLSRTFYLDFKQQIRQGQQMFWDDERHLVKTVDYFNDTLQGYVKYYSAMGIVEKEQAYIDGVLVHDTAYTELDEKEFLRREIAEYMPIFPGCEGISDDKERNQCTNDAIFGFIQEKAIYPPESRDKGIQGAVYVRFVIKEDGTVSGVELLKGIPNGKPLEIQALHSVWQLPEMIPGTQRGEEVMVQYNVPVKFKIDKGYMEGLKPNTLYNAGRSPIAQKELRERGIYTQGVDRMPIWKGCHLKGIDVTEDDCTEWRIQRHVRKNRIYPVSLKRDKPQAIVVVNFKVSEKGKVEEVRALERLDAKVYKEMQEEAERVVKSIPDFIPAKKDGKPVSFQMSVAVKFKY